MRTSSPRRRNGFTLVEILVAIAILAILTAIAVPTAYRAYSRAKTAAVKLEVTNLATAVEQYKQKYGDYPPDGSNVDVLTRHLRKVFPRILLSEFTALTYASSSAQSGFPTLDPAESLVFFLGGFSDDPQKPFTGPGGPLTIVDATTTPWKMQYNTERSNPIYDFDPSSLSITQSDFYNIGIPVTKSTDDGDSLPVYIPKNGRSPLVYFDSRTYGFVNSGSYVFNKYYGNLSQGVARPYKSNLRNTNLTGIPSNAREADRVFKYLNDKTFQIVSAGLDGNYGGILTPQSMTVGGNNFMVEVVFRYASGDPTCGDADHPGASPPEPPSSDASGYAAQWIRFNAANDANASLDNVTNFSETTLEDGLPN